MKIAFLTPMPHLVTLGGANRSIRLTAVRLAALGHDVLVCGSLLGEGPGRLRLDQLPTDCRPVTRPAWACLECEHEGVVYVGVDPLDAGLAEVEQRLVAFDPELLLVAGEDTAGQLLGLALRLGHPRVAVFAQTPDLLPLAPQSNGRLRELIESAPALVVTSEFARVQCVRAGLGNARCVIPPAFELPSQPTNAGPDGPVFLGNASAIKGIHTFVALAQARPTRDFVAVPLWATTPDDISLLETHDNVELRQPDATFSNILCDVSIALAPSTWNENFSLTVVSALAHGIPTITSDVGGMIEAGLGAARVAPVYRPEDPPDARSEALRRWLQHLDDLGDADVWRDMSARSRSAAVAFIGEATPSAFIEGVLSAFKATDMDSET